MRHLRHFCLLLLALLPLLPHAQEPGRQTEEQTIAASLQDFRSADVEVRRRAILVLSKYQHPAAVAAVIAALSDPSPEIRQSAIVAVVENSYYKQAGNRPLRMLADESVHIRRIVSTFLRTSLIDQGLMGQANGPGLDPSTAQIVRRAFLDDDPTVRKNMLTSFSLLRGIVGADSLLPLLKDPNRDIRVLALQQVGLLLVSNPEQLVRETRHLLQDDDAGIRLQLVRTMSFFSHPATREILQQLARDPAFEVATEARVTLLRFGDREHLEGLLAALDDHRLKSDGAESIIRSLPIAGEAGDAALAKLLGHERGPYRLLAIRSFGQRLRERLGFEQLRKLLDDPFAPVRQEAGMTIMMLQPQDHPADFDAWLGQLVTHRYTDVRELAVALAAQRPQPIAEPLLLDLLLDESPAVRGKAIHVVVARRLQGWQEMVRVSLGDESEAVRLQTVEALQNSPADVTRAMLRQLFTETRDEAIKAKILQRGLP